MLFVDNSMSSGGYFERRLTSGFLVIYSRTQVPSSTDVPIRIRNENIMYMPTHTCRHFVQRFEIDAAKTNHSCAWIDMQLSYMRIEKLTKGVG